MKTLKTVSIISGFLGLAGVFLASPTMSAPGKGWDTFNMGQGEMIPAANRDFKGSSGVASTGEGWDVFYTGEGSKR